MLWPSTVSTGTRQAKTGLPSSSTVQVPQVPWAQPFLEAGKADRIPQRVQ